MLFSSVQTLDVGLISKKTSASEAGQTLVFSLFLCALVIHPASDRARGAAWGLLMFLNETSAHYNTGEEKERADM